MKKLNKLKWLTQVIALPCEIQKSLFPDFSNVAEELAVDWGIEYEVLEDVEVSLKINNVQRAAFKKLDDYMESISGPENIQYWDNEALCNCAEWEIMRQMALEILNAMNWENSVPHESDAIYITKDGVF
ncbi:hypothetical protein [Snodgrassella sp. ESL0253]|uniref:hypothetical protein n=1 Tax=Snodgrassella sp. ESL0253 TaxID=2705031 RepID=UPI00193301B0|nr:hypothetical protein [Snodgrassella sp. ESL0253]